MGNYVFFDCDGFRERKRSNCFETSIKVELIEKQRSTIVLLLAECSACRFPYNLPCTPIWHNVGAYSSIIRLGHLSTSWVSSPYIDFSLFCLSVFHLWLFSRPYVFTSYTRCNKIEQLICNVVNHNYDSQSHPHSCIRA